jgi:hypothetical protein
MLPADVVCGFIRIYEGFGSLGYRIVGQIDHMRSARGQHSPVKLRLRNFMCVNEFLEQFLQFSSRDPQDLHDQDVARPRSYEPHRFLGADSDLEFSHE